MEIEVDRVDLTLFIIKSVRNARHDAEHQKRAAHATSDDDTSNDEHLRCVQQSEWNRDDAFLPTANRTPAEEESRRVLSRVRRRRSRDDPDESEKNLLAAVPIQRPRGTSTDAFGGMSPEFKAASALKTLFTMVAIESS